MKKRRAGAAAWVWTLPRPSIACVHSEVRLQEALCSGDLADVQHCCVGLLHAQSPPLGFPHTERWGLAVCLEWTMRSTYISRTKTDVGEESGAWILKESEIKADHSHKAVPPACLVCPTVRTWHLMAKKWESRTVTQFWGLRLLQLH